MASRLSALVSFISLFRAFLSFLSIHFLSFSALSSCSFCRRSSRSTCARTVQIPGMHIGPCLGQIHSSSHTFFTFVGGSGRGVLYPSYGLSSTAASPLARGWSRTGIAPDVEAPAVAPCGAPVALPSTEDAFGAVPKIAIIATALVECFGTSSSSKS